MSTQKCPHCGETIFTSTPKPKSEMTHSERAGVSYKVWLETAPLSQMSPLDRAHANNGTYGNKRRG